MCNHQHFSFKGADWDCGKHVCLALEPRHICLVCSLCITTVCFSSIFFWTQVRQRNCLNNKKTNVPKQPEEDDVGNTWCVTRIMDEIRSSSLFYCFETNAKCLLLLCSVETPSTCSPWLYYPGWPQWDESFLHVWLIIKMLKRKSRRKRAVKQVSMENVLHPMTFQKQLFLSLSFIFFFPLTHFLK